MVMEILSCVLEKSRKSFVHKNVWEPWSTGICRLCGDAVGVLMYSGTGLQVLIPCLYYVFHVVCIF